MPLKCVYLLVLGVFACLVGIWSALVLFVALVRDFELAFGGGVVVYWLYGVILHSVALFWLGSINCPPVALSCVVGAFFGVLACVCDVV